MMGGGDHGNKNLMEERSREGINASKEGESQTEPMRDRGGERMVVIRNGRIDQGEAGRESVDTVDVRGKTNVKRGANSAKCAGDAR